MTKTSKPSAPQLNLLRSMAGLEKRNTRMKPVVYKACFEKGWTTAYLGGELTAEGRAAAGVKDEKAELRFENTTARPW